MKKKDKNTRILRIRWQRLITKGKTCPRCGSTEQELEKATTTLKQVLAPLGIEVILEKQKLSIAEFKKDPLQSNKIWINNQVLEDWLGVKSGRSSCCDVCGSSECRTIEAEGKTYEAIPADLIIKAGLIAASKFVGDKIPVSCCGNENPLAKS
ncbi:MAG: DUF2703 domain-containing protein [Candidatus Omnitrophica bacterium]|nr:DUF2703 domain-containing protein [Candidatus Omnitrophota bacterium]